jgi:uncharacterized protein (TIGR00299 family) protein
VKYVAQVSVPCAIFLVRTLLGQAKAYPTRYNETVPLTCYLDAFSGISGDMLVGALVDAGAATEAITTAIVSLDAGAVVSFEKVKRNGIGATKYHVAVPHEHAHRHLSHIVKMIEGGAMPARAKANAVAIFQKLGEAEARVHQIAIEKVHFHEVGAVDSIADIVGAAVAFDALGVETIFCSPINVGSGTVKAAHGVLPVPAPATALLLTGVPVYSNGPQVELTTPTGAAVAATLSKSFGPMPPLRITGTGFGAGGYDFPDQANVLRVILGEPTGADEPITVTVLETNVDDLSPQILAFAMEKLFEGGALDVTVQPVLMKKGRSGHLLRVVARMEDCERLSEIIFAQTSTLGLRLFAAERRVQARTWREVETPYGKVRIKFSSSGAYAPEYDDCRKLAVATGVPVKQIIAEANFAYLKLTR